MLRTCVLSCAAIGLLGFVVGCEIKSTPSSLTISTKEAAVKDVETKLNGLEKSMEIVGAHPEGRGKGCERG